MAEFSKKDLLCRFSMRGFCRDQAACPFSHDNRNAVVVPDSVCWYNLLDSCKFTHSCRQDHMSPAEIVKSVRSPSSNETRGHAEPIATSPPISNASQTRLMAQATSAPIVKSGLNHGPHSNSRDKSVVSPRQGSEDSGFSESPSSSNSSHCPAQSARHPLITSLSATSSVFTPRCPYSYATSSSSGYHNYHTPTSSNYQCEYDDYDPNCGKSYAQVCKDKLPPESLVDLAVLIKAPLCPYAIVSFECPNAENCNYLHGERCDLCNRLCLHPYNQEQRREHRDECVREHEKQMELSFAIQRSVDKSCGVCMDTIMEKEPPSERRFGILEKCAHIFCLNCIRKWRQTKQFDNRTIRACPECRVASDFVVPSRYWVDDKDEKDKLITSYKKALSQKPCKYFKQGRGECPFAGACFYLHAYPDGRKAEMAPPRARRRANNDGELETLRDMLLWNYLEVREDRNHWLLSLDVEDLLDMQDMGLFSETDDESDYSDYDQLVEV